MPPLPKLSLLLAAVRIENYLVTIAFGGYVLRENVVPYVVS